MRWISKPFRRMWMESSCLIWCSSLEVVEHYHEMLALLLLRTTMSCKRYRSGVCVLVGVLVAMVHWITFQSCWLLVMAVLNQQKSWFKVINYSNLVCWIRYHNFRMRFSVLASSLSDLRSERFVSSPKIPFCVCVFISNIKMFLFENPLCLLNETHKFTMCSLSLLFFSAVFVPVLCVKRFSVALFVLVWTLSVACCGFGWIMSFQLSCNTPKHTHKV